MSVRKYMPVTAIILVLFSSFVSSSPLNRYDFSKNIQDTIPGNDSLNTKLERPEFETSYPGGEKAWQEYLHKNVDSTIPMKYKAPAGTYTVVVQFIFDREGTISDAKAVTNHGYGMEEAVLRVVKKTSRWGPWIPAKQNAKIVIGYTKQSYTFHVAGKKKKKKRTNATK